MRVRMVWSGPASRPGPVRATVQALIDVVGEAHGETLESARETADVLYTYSCRRCSETD